MKNNGPTIPEAATWTAFGIAAGVYIISGLIFVNEDSITAAGWMTFSQWIVAATLVPGILLTGIRALIPREDQERAPGR